MATTTSNLSLRRPESTDTVNVALDIAANMTTIDDKWATSAAADIGAAAAAGSALTVARTDHVHKVGSGTVSDPGLPVGESNTGLYRPGTGQLGITLLGTLIGAFQAAGLVLEKALGLKHVTTPSASASGYDHLYVKSDHALYSIDSSGTERVVRSVGATTNTVLRGTGTDVASFGAVQTDDIAANAVTAVTTKSVSSTSTTTVSVTPGDMTGSSFSHTSSGGYTLAFVSLLALSNASDCYAYVNLNVDGSDVAALVYNERILAGHNRTIGVTYPIGTLSAGSHTIKLRWAMAAPSAGTLSILGAQIAIVELKR